jgi:mRNA-degrading endonuclease RelE of RelBE toxin-antitoxin system
LLANPIYKDTLSLAYLGYLILAKQYWVNCSPEFKVFFDSLDQKSVLWKDIDAAIDALKLNPLKGNKIEKDRWPKKYKKEVKINNLFRYPLHNGYRLIYTLISDTKSTTSVLLEAMDHDSYEKRFGYD